MSGAGPIGGASPITSPGPLPLSSPAPAPAASATPTTSPVRGSATPGRMAAAAAMSSRSPHPATAAEVRAAADAIPRTWDRGTEKTFQWIVGQLDGSVTDKETGGILQKLQTLEPGQFMAIMDHLQQASWKGNRNLLHKLMRRGVQDDQRFIATFARLATRQLGLDLYIDHRAGMDQHQRDHATADAGAAVLERFEGDTEANFGMDMVNAIEEFGDDLGRIADHAGKWTLLAIVAVGMGIEHLFD